jgi:hypothetical protein
MLFLILGVIGALALGWLGLFLGLILAALIDR